MGKAGEKHVSLTKEEKLRVIHEHDRGDKKTQNELVAWITKTMKKNVSRASVAKMIKNRDKLDQMLNPESKRVSSVDHPLHDKSLYEWILRHESLGILTDDIVKMKAKQFAVKLEITDDFTMSNGWLQKFKHRYGIKSWIKHGEKGSVDETVITAALPDLRQKLSAYPPDCVYNMDETGLFFRMLPSRSLATHAVPGHKKDKTRITIALCVNSDGSDKLPLLVIGKAKKPRCFAGVNMKNLGVDYKSNASSWMTAMLFQEWIKDWDQKLKAKKKKVLLLLDNLSSHNVSRIGLSQIETLFLPPNTTSRLQPLDAGIIETFKRYYRKRMLRWMINMIEQGNRNARIDLKTAIEFADAAYEQLSRETIQNCWITTGIISSESSPSLASLTGDTLQHEIDLLGLPDALNERDYLMLEGENVVESPDDDDDVIATVTSDGEDEPSDITPVVKISNAKAKECLSLLRRYYEQQSDDCTPLISKLKSIHLDIECRSVSSLKQSTMDSFLNRSHV